MTRELSAKDVGEIVKLYHEILIEQSNLKRTECEGPNAISTERMAAERLLTELIPRYREIVPQEIQNHLNIDLRRLENMCRE